MKTPAIRLLAFLLLVFAPCAPAFTGEDHHAGVETGAFDGAAWRIDLPKKWNRALIVFYHGYRKEMVRYDAAPAKGLVGEWVRRGYAVVQSGYSKSGWAVEQAVPETERVRRHFISRHGRPKDTYASGVSMGGMLAVLAVEQFPERYDGALPLCAVLQPASFAFQRMFAMRAAFDHYYPDALPGPVHIPADAALDDATVRRVMDLLAGNAQGRAQMMALMQIKSDQDLAGVMVFSTWILRSFEQMLGTSPFDNRNWIYAGGPDDHALNAAVKRYRGDTSAAAYLTKHYTPTGVLRKPALAVHNVYDPLIPALSVSIYADEVARKGFARNLVQQYVTDDGHCKFDSAQIAGALDELVQWRRTGARPEPGRVRAAAAAAAR